MRVYVYFNLNKRLWSIRAMEGPLTGRVVAHARKVLLEDVEFRVSEAGRQRVIREKRKNVHAGAVGKLVRFEGDWRFNASDIGMRASQPYQITWWTQSELFTQKIQDKWAYEPSVSVLPIEEQPETVPLDLITFKKVTFREGHDRWTEWVLEVKDD